MRCFSLSFPPLSSLLSCFCFSPSPTTPKLSPAESFPDLAWLLDRTGQNPIYCPPSNPSRLALLHLSLRLRPCPSPTLVSLFGNHAVRLDSTGGSPVEDVFVLWFVWLLSHFFHVFLFPVFFLYVVRLYLGCGWELYFGF